jgi:hypothetical protein
LKELLLRLARGRRLPLELHHYDVHPFITGVGQVRRGWRIDRVPCLAAELLCLAVREVELALPV